MLYLYLVGSNARLLHAVEQDQSQRQLFAVPAGIYRAAETGDVKGGQAKRC